MIDTTLLTDAERAVFSLRSLYGKYGYLPFKMSKFEEYDLYVKNKDFLVSDNVITFNDTDGRLLALKPDVTLSIIKNLSVTPGCKQKVYYNENVYRVSPKVHRFKEIMQAGLECIGDTDITDIFEAVDLAAESLNIVSGDFALDLSHLGILSAVLEWACADTDFAKGATALIAEKNKHELASLCKSFGVPDGRAEAVLSLVDMYGDMKNVLARLEPICIAVGASAQFSELSELCALLSNSKHADRIKLDFSVVNDMSYYNGIVFTGFIEGIADGVLAGGEYGMLMSKMGKAAGAVGFAIYLDMLEEISAPAREYDVDTLIVYGEKCDTGELLSLKNKLISEGERVSLQKAIPELLRYKKIIKLDK